MIADRYWILGSGTADSVEPKRWSALRRDCHVLLQSSVRYQQKQSTVELIKLLGA